MGGKKGGWWWRKGGLFIRAAAARSPVRSGPERKEEKLVFFRLWFFCALCYYVHVCVDVAALPPPFLCHHRECASASAHVTRTQTAKTGTRGDEFPLNQRRKKE